ncbi:dTDP-glucose 4,6-dehydratase [Radiobacillus sp. PE A8.2]|uniref:dTDP-glucose 4,6-dehydratase n=1 Tax=Radiobacillus sp. PE A8.2 TaxID=3380349 RepID=UPI00388D9204
MKRKRVLITGGAGFIGGNFVSYLINKYPQYDIYNLDLLTYAGELAKHEKIEMKDNYHFIHADIKDRQTIFSIFERNRFDYVIHFAAETHVDRSIKDPEIFVLTNVLGTQILLDASKAYDVKKFIYMSTDEVYGDLELDSTVLFTEDSLIQPNSPYSASKASADLLVRAYYQTYGLPINIIRCSNNYGPYQMPDKLIPLTISRLLQNQKVPIYGDGKNIRDWLHVQDHCDAIDVVVHKGVRGEVYNVGSYNERTNLEVVRTIVEALDKSGDLIEFVTDRLGHDKRYAIEAIKIEQLGWQPLYDFETGIRETVAWYVANREWWEGLMGG